MDYATHVEYLRARAAARPTSTHELGKVSFGRPLAEYAHERAERLGIVNVTARVVAWGEEGAHLLIDCPFCDGTDERVVTEDWPGDLVYFSGCRRRRYRVIIGMQNRKDI